MVTRSELRAQQRAAATQSTVNKKNLQPSVRKHHLFNLWGTIILGLLMLCLIMNATLLNRHFAVHEIKDSIVATTITDQVNAGLERYGIPNSALTDRETNHLLTQVVDQVYAGKKLRVDLSPVMAHVGSSVNSQLAQYGLAGAGGTAMTALSQNVNDAVNAQLNSTAVTKFVHVVQLIRTSVTIITVVTALVMLIMVVQAVLHRHLIISFSKICIGAVIIDGLLVWLVTKVGPQLVEDQPDYVSFVIQLVTDFSHRAMAMLSVVLVIGLTLLAIRIVRWGWGSNR
jgi:hypothetical protein